MSFSTQSSMGASISAMASGLSLRERKKQRTRQALHDTAVRLFLEHGYDNVTVSDVAAEAETAVTTLFKYFPEGKVALAFAGDEDRASALANAIRARPVGTDPLQAVERFIRARGPFGPRPGISADLARFIFTTPALRAYARQRWTDCEPALADVLAAESGRRVDAQLRALARFVLETPDLAAEERHPGAAVAAIFRHLRAGWPPAPNAHG
jgi:AcrR family transcriptional regulator